MKLHGYVSGYVRGKGVGVIEVADQLGVTPQAVYARFKKLEKFDDEACFEDALDICTAAAVVADRRLGRRRVSA